MNGLAESRTFFPVTVDIIFKIIEASHYSLSDNSYCFPPSLIHTTG